MQNQSEKTIEERRLEARRALEGEDRGRKREEDIQRRKDEVERKTREKEQKIKLEEKQKKDEVEKTLRAEEESKKEAVKKEAERKHTEKEKKIKQEALLKQMRPPGKKLRPLNKEVEIKIKNGAEEVKIPHIKTYKSDATEAIKKQGESLTKIVLAEKKKVKEKSLSAKTAPSVKTKRGMTATRKVVIPKKSNHKILIIVSGLMIISISGGVLIYLYQINKKEVPILTPKIPETGVVVTPAIVRALITANTEKNINISGERTAVLNTIVKEFRETSGTGSIKNIYLTETTTIFTARGEEGVQRISSVRELLSMWSHKMPALLSRSLSSEFMLGVYSSTPGRNIPFLILTTNSYEQTFAGMFGWEDNILNDFYKLFGLEINKVTQSFHDDVIRGNDVRTLKNQTGDTLLLYSFVTKNMLIVTTDEEVLNKILFRLKRVN